MVAGWQNLMREQVPLHQPQQGVLDSADAAVMIAITDHDTEPHLVLTKRAQQLSSHGGEVAFPGGKRDLEDRDIVVTALRESLEEIQLPPESVELVGTLPMAVSKAGLKVVPVVGIIPEHLTLVASEAEIESIFQVPLTLFASAPPEGRIERKFRGGRYQVPCYCYQGYEIWGLTAYIIWDFCNRVFARGWSFPMPVPLSQPE